MAQSIDFILELEYALSVIRTTLVDLGAFDFEETPIQYGIKFCFGDGTSFVLYYKKAANGVQNTSKIIFAKQTSLTDKIIQKLGGITPKTIENHPSTHTQRQIKEIPSFESHIGTDESGKGDYFGPLVVAGVLLTKEQEKILSDLGVRDSKSNSDEKNLSLAKQIIEIVGADKISIVSFNPDVYNQLYEEMGSNSNNILGWAHAKAMESILQKNDCKNAIADQFGNECVITKHLMTRGKKLNLIQTPKGERDVAVAAASIVARAKFLIQIQKLQEQVGFTLPKGAGSEVDITAKQIYQKSGIEGLRICAKLHFKTTEKAKS